MAKSTTIVKRKMGRPVEIGAGATEFVALRLPTALLDRITAWGKQKKVDQRSEAIRQLIERGLERD
jgi:hypothetical protein